MGFSKGMNCSKDVQLLDKTSQIYHEDLICHGAVRRADNAIVAPHKKKCLYCIFSHLFILLKK